MTDLSTLKKGDKLLIGRSHGDRLGVTNVVSVYKRHLRDDAGYAWDFDGAPHDRIGSARSFALPFDSPEAVAKLAAWEAEKEAKQRRDADEAAANARRWAFQDAGRIIGGHIAGTIAKVMYGLGTGNGELTDDGVAEMKAIISIIEARGKP